MNPVRSLLKEKYIYIAKCLHSKKEASNGMKSSHAFTIVELLVVIVVIAILAAITIVAYASVTQKAVASSLQSDLTNASTQLNAYQVLYGSFPTSLDNDNCPTAPTEDTNYCLKASSGNTLTYSQIAGKTFHLTATSGNTSWSITDTTAPAIATTTPGSPIGSACPTGFIPVPGSGTYGTNDFCVMKYEAKQVGTSTTPISQASGTPWVSISQTTAITNSQNVADCTGCHLISEAEWMTIAQNVLSVASNWSTGTVGSGYIYSGHNDSAPANALVADTNDSNGYYGETNTGGNQKRTLTLTNGQVIWDLAGNVYEWTTETIAGGQSPGLSGESTGIWKQWNNSALLQNGLPTSAMPSYTGITGASGWNSTQGIGQLFSNYGDSGTRGFARGGDWTPSIRAGVLSLYLGLTPGNPYSTVGFRVAR